MLQVLRCPRTPASTTRAVSPWTESVDLCSRPSSTRRHLVTTSWHGFQPFQLSLAQPTIPARLPALESRAANRVLAALPPDTRALSPYLLNPALCNALESSARITRASQPPPLLRPASHPLPDSSPTWHLRSLSRPTRSTLLHTVIRPNCEGRAPRWTTSRPRTQADPP